MFVRVVLPLAILGLMVYTLADLAGSDEEDRGGLPTWLWVLIIILLPVFGAAAWLVLKQQRRRSAGWGQTGRGGRPGRSPRRPSGPVAPDDDPDFLWRLEQERRRRERKGEGEGTPDDADDGPASPA